MWAVVSPIQSIPILTKPRTLTVSANSHPQNATISSKNMGGLGHTLISALNSTPNPIPKQQKQDKQKEEGKQLSGSDVLWALQRAATQKNKKNKKRRESSSACSNIQEDVVDYTNVKPLHIKSEWGVKLNDLEQRLQELSETI